MKYILKVLFQQIEKQGEKKWKTIMEDKWLLKNF